MNGWIGIDLDGTLAHYDGWKGPGHIGPPVPAMLARARAWLAEGRDVRLMTARASNAGPDATAFLAAWRSWSLEHLGQVLAVTCVKDYGMIELWDDRAVQVVPNTGRRADGQCLAYEQPVFTARGALEAGSLAAVGADFTVVSRLPDGTVGGRRAGALQAGERPCVEVVTRLGSFITSASHPFLLTYGLSVPAADLRSADPLYTGSNDYVRCCGTLRVLDVRPLGARPVITVQVDDDEPNDLRPWSAHNFALAPIGTTGLLSGFVFTIAR